jgi:hypothetical protein
MKGWAFHIAVSYFEKLASVVMLDYEYEVIFNMVWGTLLVA